MTTQPSKRPLGKSGLQVAPLALGGNVFGWTIDEKQSFSVLDAFIDLGFNLIDTANMYSTWVPGHRGGESEQIIGNWLKATGKRSRVVIATKVGMEMGDGSKGLRKTNIFKAVEESLQRLQTDVIDLYQSHQDDEETPLEETLSAYDALLKQGKVRAIGASNYTAARLKLAIETSRKAGLPVYQTLQPNYNLYDRKDFESGLQSVCETEGVGVISYFSLASGFLSGKYRSQKDLAISKRGAGVDKYLNDRGFRILGALDQVASAHGTRPATVALAWLIQRPTVVAPIASATTVDQLRELTQSTALKLTREEVAALDKASEG